MEDLESCCRWASAGTTTLFAALSVLNGAVLATGKPRHPRRHRAARAGLDATQRAGVAAQSAELAAPAVAALPGDEHAVHRGCGPAIADQSLGGRRSAGTSSRFARRTGWPAHNAPAMMNLTFTNLRNDRKQEHEPV
jgi:hypothetical protein